MGGWEKKGCMGGECSEWGQFTSPNVVQETLWYRPTVHHNRPLPASGIYC